MLEIVVLPWANKFHSLCLSVLICEMTALSWTISIIPS